MLRVLSRLALVGSVLAAFATPLSADPVLFVSNSNGVISHYSLSGAPLGTFTTVSGQATGLAVHEQVLYVADYFPNNLVRPFASDGTPLPTLAPGLGPTGMAFDASGNMFVSNQLGGTIRKFAPDGGDLGLFVASLNQPWGLAFDASGNLYVAIRGASEVRKYAADGTPLGVFASGSLNQPIGIAFDALGNLLVANFGNNTIRKFSPSGTDLGVFASSGVSQPTEIAFDDDGNLYVANWGSSSVRLFAADGTDLGDLVTGLSQPQGIAIMRDPPSAVSNLQVSALTGKGVAGAGLSYAAKDTTRNNGEAATPASQTWFFLSTNSVKDGSDLQLVPQTGRGVGPLTPGATSTGTTAVTIPSDTAAGKWFFLACADGPGAIAESNEVDNCRAKTVYVGPDLKVSKLTAPVSGIPGQTIAVTDTTQNAGGAPTAVVTTTRLYLSDNKKLDASDVPLGPGRSVGILAAGGKSADTTNVTIPLGTAPGAYYILAKADDGGVQVESKETNNVKYAPLTVN
jgi:sugar lactone lactonase YvrE